MGHGECAAPATQEQSDTLAKRPGATIDSAFERGRSAAGLALLPIPMPGRTARLRTSARKFRSDDRGCKNRELTRLLVLNTLSVASERSVLRATFEQLGIDVKALAWDETQTHHP